MVLPFPPAASWGKSHPEVLQLHPFKGPGAQGFAFQLPILLTTSQERGRDSWRHTIRRAKEIMVAKIAAQLMSALG